MDEIEDYIKGLSRISEREQIYQYFERQKELSHRLKEPVSKALHDGINEIRPGPHRFLFFYQAHQIIVVHAFRKKTRATPLREIEAAVKRKGRYLTEGK